MSNSVKSLGTWAEVTCLLLFAMAQSVHPMGHASLSGRPALTTSRFAITRHTPEEVNNGAARSLLKRLTEPVRIIQSCDSIPRIRANHEPLEATLWPSWAGLIHRRVEPSRADDH